MYRKHIKSIFQDFELIIVNDGSTDQSEEKCKKYIKQDKRISLYTKDNGGVSSARNYGINKAIGEYSTFVDADDYLYQNCYEEVNENIKTQDLVFFII